MKIISSIILLFITLNCKPSDANCLVERVIDGDTFVCGGVKVRIAEIDAPEIKQLFGLESKQHLESLINNEVVALQNEKRDRYSRTIATVMFQGENIGYKMVGNGLAWQYKQYSKSQELGSHQRTAMSRRLNLWREDNPTPPWEFRKIKSTN